MMLFTFACLLGLTQNAYAAPDPSHPWEWGVTCYSFANDQDAAQTYFNQNGQPADLDWNGNGIACEGEGDGDYTPHATATHDPTCGTWAGDQAAAQDYYDTVIASSQLDWNGNGIACEDGNDGDFLAWPDAPSDGASVWPGIDCAEFPYGVAAATAYYATWGGPESLDPDGDGTACNEGAADPDAESGPSAWPAWTCYTFPDGWDAAIDYYNMNGGPASLDADGDGMPCESNGDDEMVECRDLGGPQHIAQDYFEAHGMPENLDLDGDGLACMNTADGYWGDTEPRPASLPNDDEGESEPAVEDAPADTETASTDTPADGTAGSDPVATEPAGTVSQLPSTGSGPMASASLPLAMLIGLGALTVTMAVATLRATRRRT
jgi:hypothetical protein